MAHSGDTIFGRAHPKTDEEAQHHGWPTLSVGGPLCMVMVWIEIWTRHFLCPMKYNRLVLFRTHLWHSHNYNFGDTLENGRMVQLFNQRRSGK